MSTKAVLFDFGGTLYDYGSLEGAERESLLELARWAGIEAGAADVGRAHRESLRRVFRDYLPREFYHHRDLFRDALIGMLEALGAKPEGDVLERYRQAQWSRHARDFVLREGVHETLAELRGRGLHLGIVSNIDDDQLDHLIDLGQLRERFDSLLSSEEARSCKPDPGIYREALRRAGCQPEEALFVGDTLLQDIAGANRMGMRSVLLWHRDDREPATDAVRPHHRIRRIPEVIGLL
jgi:2-haloalkanoic acid dehalogenase type II